MTSDDERPDQRTDAPADPPPDGSAPPPAAAPWPAAAVPPPAAPTDPPAAAVPPPGPPAPAGLPPGAPSDLPPGAPGGVYPAGVYPAGTSVLGGPVAPISSRPDSRKRNGIIGGVIAGAIAIVALFLKFGLPILVGTAVSGVLGGVFGGPFERLPDDQQKALEQRFDAAMGDTLKDLSDAETATKVTALLNAGLPRLGDDLLVDKVHLTGKLLNGTDEATCARLARATATAAGDSDAMSTALGAMDATFIGRWFEINISAIEAEARGAPPVRAVEAAESDRVLADVFARFTATESEQINDLFAGTQVPDSDACNAVRALYTHIEELPPADLALAARYDVMP